MAVVLSGGNGLLDVLGALAAGLNENNVQIGATATTRQGTILGIATATPQKAALASLFSTVTSYRTTTSGYQQAIQQMAQAVLLNMFNADAPLVPNTIGQGITKLIAQMVTQAVTIKRPTTLTGTVAVGGSNVGDAVAAVTVVADNGVPLQSFFSEVLTATVTSDYSVQSTLAKAEPYSLIGPPLAANALGWDWPNLGTTTTGSGTNTSLSILDAAVDATSTNGDFENWTSTVPITPVGWTVVVGTAGTSILRAASPVLTGQYALEFVGDGAELTAIKQQVTVAPLSTYAFNVFVRASAAYTGGALAFSLVDGSGTVINDQAGTANTITLGATAAANASWTSVKGFFRLPQNPPATVYLRIALTSAIQSGKNLFFDRLILSRALSPAQLYTGGSRVVIFSGGTNSVKGDTFMFTLTNNWANTTPGGFVQFFERCFAMRTNGLVLPSATSPTISDALIA